MALLHAQLCPRFYARISQIPHKRQEYISSSRATLMSKHERRQQGEAFLERQVQNYSAHCSCALVFEPSPEAPMICRKTEDSMLFVLAGLQLEVHLWGIETQADLLASFKGTKSSHLVIAELVGLILVLFLEERLNSLHKPHHFTQDDVLGQGQAL